MSDGIGRAGNFLVRAGDDEIGRIHRNQVGRVLAGKMMVLVVLLPIQVRVQILALLQCVRNIALCHSHAVRKHRGHQVSIGVVSNDEIWPLTKLGDYLARGFFGELFEIGPSVKSRYPIADDLTLLISKRDTQDTSVACARYLLNTFVTRCSFGFGDQPSQDKDLWFDRQALLVDGVVNLSFECPHLVEDIDDLAPCIRFSQHAGLSEIPMR